MFKTGQNDVIGTNNRSKKIKFLTEKMKETDTSRVNSGQYDEDYEKVGR